MKILRKILISLLAITFILQCSNLVRATENEGYEVKLQPNKTAVSEGETFEVTVVLDNINVGQEGLGIYACVIEYDATIFDVTSIRALGDWENPTMRKKPLSAGETIQKLAFTSDTKSGEGYTTRQEVAVITVKTLQDSEVGPSSIVLKNFQASTGTKSIYLDNDLDLEIRIKGETITSISSQNGVVTIPSEKNGRTVTDIGEYVVTDLENTRKIIIPSSVVEISENAFKFRDGSRKEDLTIQCEKGSYAEEYARNNGFTYETEGEVEVNTLGDINEDNKINATDLLLLKRHIIAGSKTQWILTGNKFTNGDMNNDNLINATDLLLLKRAVLRNML